jgi:hypothetical protein
MQEEREHACKKEVGTGMRRKTKGRERERWKKRKRRTGRERIERGGGGHNSGQMGEPTERRKRREGEREGDQQDNGRGVSKGGRECVCVGER